MARSVDKYAARRLKNSYVTTIVSVSLVLFTLGLIVLLLLHAQKLSDYVKENIGFSVIMNKNVKEADILKLQKELDAQEYVKSTEFISEEKAAELFEKEFGEDFIGLIGYNPLHSSIMVHLKADFANPEKFTEIEKDILKNKNVREVYYQKNLVHLVNENVRKISLIILGFVIIFLIIAIALINNTIRLSVHSKRFLIRSMQLVGATESFIRRPFVITGIFHGFISSVIAIGGLWVVIYLSRKQIPDIINLQSTDLFVMLFLFVIITGILITGLSTFMAVRKFLRTPVDTLYNQ